MAETPGANPEPFYATFPKTSLLTPEDHDRAVLKIFGLQSAPPGQDPESPRPADPVPAADPAPANPTPASPVVPAAPDPAAPVPGATPQPAPAVHGAPRDPRRIDRPTADDIVNRIKAELQPAAQTPPAPAEPDQAETDGAIKLRLDALDLLANESKEFKGRDLKGEYKTYLQAHDKYKQEWEAKHPDQEFNLDDDSHQAWRDKNIPNIDDDVVEKAELRVQWNRDMERRDRDREVRETTQVLNQMATEQAVNSERAILSFKGKEFEGSPLHGKEFTSLEQLDAADPLAAMIVERHLDAVRQQAASATKILTRGSPIQPNPNDPADQAVIAAVSHYERAAEAAAKAGHSLLDGLGRAYVSAEQYERLKPDEQAKAWTFRRAPEMIIPLIERDARTALRTEYDRRASKFKPATPGVPATTTVRVVDPPATLRAPGGGGGPVVNPPDSGTSTGKTFSMV